MKKTKLAVLFTAFMAMMGLSSCLGDPDPYNYGTEYVKIIPSEYGYSFMSSGRIILNPADQSLVGTSLIGKEYAWINYKYEREALDITRLEEQCTSDKVVLKIHHDDLAASEDKDNDKQDYGEIRYINLYSLLQGQVPDKLVLKFNIYDGNNDKIKEDSCVVDYKAIVDTYFKNQF